MAKKKDRNYRKFHGVTAVEGTRTYYGPRSKGTITGRIKDRLRNASVSDAIANVGLLGSITGISAMMVTGAECFLGFTPFACGAAVFAFYTTTTCLSERNILKAALMATAVTGAAMVASTFLSVPGQAALAAAGLAAYHYFHNR